MTAYIAKPIDAGTMLQVIKSFLQAEDSSVHANDTLNTPVDVAVVTPIFNRLLKYINGMDGKAEHYLDDYHEELAGLPILDIGQIKAYLNIFEFTTARDALLALSARNGICLSLDSTEDCKL